MKLSPIELLGLTPTRASALPRRVVTADGETYMKKPERRRRGRPQLRARSPQRKATERAASTRYYYRDNAASRAYHRERRRRERAKATQ